MYYLSVHLSSRDAFKKSKIMFLTSMFMLIFFAIFDTMNFRLASRALGLLIAKCKIIGGVPYSVFTKLYDSVVWPVISYSSPIWGIKSYSGIDAVHNRHFQLNPILILEFDIAVRIMFLMDILKDNM